MKSTLQAVQDCRAELFIQFENDEAKKAYASCVREASKDVRVAGFPPGKVPQSIIEEKVGKKYLEFKAVEKLLHKHLDAALAQTQVKLLGQPTLKESNFDFSDNLVLTLNLELQPKVKLPSIAGLKLLIPEPKLKDVTVDSLLEGLAVDLAPWTELTGTDVGVRKGDRLRLDYKGKLPDGSDGPADAHGEDAEVLALPDNFAPNIYEGILGMAPGQTKEILSSFPEDFPHAELTNKDINFTVTLRKVERKIPLPIDENLAKLAKRESLSKLKDDLKLEIEKAEAVLKSKHCQAALLNELIEQSQLDIPAWMIEREARTALKNAYHGEHSDNPQTGECEHSDPEPDFDNISLSADNLAEAELRLRGNMILTALAESENMNISKQELSNYLSMWCKLRNISPSDVPQETVRFLAFELLCEKTLLASISKVEVETKPATDDAIAEIDALKSKLRAAFPSL